MAAGSGGCAPREEVSEGGERERLADHVDGERDRVFRAEHPQVGVIGVRDQPAAGAIRHRRGG